MALLMAAHAYDELVDEESLAPGPDAPYQGKYGWSSATRHAVIVHLR